MKKQKDHSQSQQWIFFARQRSFMLSCSFRELATRSDRHQRLHHDTNMLFSKTNAFCQNIASTISTNWRKLLSLWRVLDGLGSDASAVFCLVVHEQVVRVALGRRIRIRFVQQVLDACQNLLHGNRRTPTFLFVQDTQANRPRWVHVGVEQRRNKFACHDDVDFEGRKTTLM